MTREEIEAEIKELEYKRFLNDMCDHWSAEHYAYDRRLSMQIMDLKKYLEAMSDGCISEG